MGQTVMDEAVSTVGFSNSQVSEWQNQVQEQRGLLFNRNWKNRRPVVGLSSRAHESEFRFVLEWCDDFPDVVGRTKSRQRMDKIIAMGLDVNADPADLPEIR